ncbi:acyl-ACP thioesterase domain-containing protein [Vagococcus fluvialis]|uniref:acyl-ACP thioesterase domain-containing protein n=1 Tax=Vagococcus fluvialis TaxID=2738 RepID=UPI001A8F6F3E|nr:acyl-[acyl-carrier-protein] thioesterase [Vagococcus fluvialis]
MAKQYSEIHQIPYYECDRTQYLKISTLVKMLIKISGAQSESLGVSDEHMASLGLGWIILQHDIDIKRLPKAHETIKLTTEAESYNKFFCYRHFWVHDEEGNECAFMSTTFAIMDLHERKMGSVDEAIIAPFESEKIKRIKRGEKILPVTEINQEKTYGVRYFDIDLNQHVNNAVYLDWILDALEGEFLESHNPEKIAIKFNKEVLYGDDVTSGYQLVDGNTTYHSITSKNELSAEANIKWVKKD